jgi:ribose transport system permease protein
MESIAAVVIGGGSLFGGEGRAIGVVIGAIILGILSNLMNILNVNMFMQSIIKGIILLGAVYINLINSRLKK